MSVLIRGMEMPKSCDECPLYTCMHNHDNCPLVPVPAHGRLIDADAIRADIDEKRPGRSYEDAWTLTVAHALLEEAERKLKAGKMLLEEAQRISTEILTATSGSGEGPEQPGRYEDLAASLAGEEE